MKINLGKSKCTYVVIRASGVANLQMMLQIVPKNKSTRVPGEISLRDVQLIEAIYKAADTCKTVSTKDVQNVVDLVSKR